MLSGPVSCTLFLLGVLLEFDTKSMHAGPGFLHSISPCISIGIGYKINTLWPWPPALCFSSFGIQYKINALWPWPPARRSQNRNILIRILIRNRIFPAQWAPGRPRSQNRNILFRILIRNRIFWAQPAPGRPRSENRNLVWWIRVWKASLEGSRASGEYYVGLGSW